MEDYYAILGVSRNATQDEIKSAYHKKASMYHPDISNDPFANEKMAKVNEAYSILKDPDKRSEYDTYGSTKDSNYEYSPKNEYYEYSRGYIYPKSRFSFWRFLLIILFFPFLLRALYSIILRLLYVLP